MPMTQKQPAAIISKAAEYGAKRDYPKIELYLHRPAGWTYMATTTWSRTCREAKAKFCEANGHAGSDVRARFQTAAKRHRAMP
jgi:hypothetical protein